MAAAEKQIILVGVGHVFDISSQVQDIIAMVQPDVVALELDRNRLRALLSPGGEHGNLPFFHMLLASLQERIAKKYGVATGSEMAAAAKTARDNTIGILCIDRDVQMVMARLWSSIPLRKKVLFMVSGISSLFLSKKRVEKEISSFETKPQTYLREMQSTLPELYTILIEERNHHMASRLRQALDMYDSVVAFVGEGHIPGMAALLDSDEIAVTVIHLSDLRGNKWRDRLPETAPA
ncbi:MAG: TraB domain-containing protein [Thermoplasmatota archaeon]